MNRHCHREPEQRHEDDRQWLHRHTFGLGDFGYPLVNNNYIVSDEALRTQRDAVKALLRAEIRGWKASLSSPALSARITVDEYGRDLGLTLAEAEGTTKKQAQQEAARLAFASLLAAPTLASALEPSPIELSPRELSDTELSSIEPSPTELSFRPQAAHFAAGVEKPATHSADISLQEVGS